MKIAVIGGGASGMVSAYLLDKQGHHVTVFERQPMLGGHIRTLNKNVKPDRSDCTEILEGGVLEFPTAFTDFIAPEQIIHTQAHHTPMYTTKSFRYRDEVVATNGENYTYHAGAYLGDGLHGGAITSAIRVTQLIGVSQESISSVESNRERISFA